MKKLFLFDIDGTLLRMKSGLSAVSISGIFKDVFAIEIPADYDHDYSGKTDRQIIMELAEAFHVPLQQVERQMQPVIELLSVAISANCTAENVRMLVGVVDLLAEVARQEDLGLGLLTGNVQRAAYAKLRPHSIEHYFPFGAFGCDHHQRNNLPPIALRRARDWDNTAGFTAAATVIIGDTPRDIECAHANGMKAVAVATGNYSVEALAAHKPDLLLRDFADWRNSAERLLNLV